MLGLTALDAFIGGFATAFFGALVAGGSCLFRQQVQLKQRLEGLEARLDGLASLERLLQAVRPTEGRAEQAATGSRATSGCTSRTR